MLGCKPTKTPIEQNHKLFLCLDATSTDKARYQRLVGKLIYLSHTRPDIAYAHNHLKVEGYTDADWAGSADNRRSTSGYFTFVGGNLVTWRSKKQPVVARSSAEADYRGMAFGVCELLWLRNLLIELGVDSQEAMKLYCDNTSAKEKAC
ncbi:hypothetical protein UlMin_027654 [Ulmus minor]